MRSRFGRRSVPKLFFFLFLFLLFLLHRAPCLDSGWRLITAVDDSAVGIDFPDGGLEEAVDGGFSFVIQVEGHELNVE